LSRTVGWFTTTYPVRLEVIETESAGGALKRIKEQLRRIPSRGLGYGVLKYLSEETDVKKQMREMANAEVLFNYLGQFDQVVNESEFWAGAVESAGSNQSELGDRSHLLEINGLIAGGQLRMSWSYSESRHRRETVKQIACEYLERLRELIAHCQLPEAGGYTPSDFPKARLSQQELDELLAELP
jgi:non-ribosomal peptide synthase protein (TIGR01720 family)